MRLARWQQSPSRTNHSQQLHVQQSLSRSLSRSRRRPNAVTDSSLTHSPPQSHSHHSRSHSHHQSPPAPITHECGDAVLPYLRQPSQVTSFISPAIAASVRRCCRAGEGT
ncbi:hypothetical protein CUMW_166830 [Citrus unshiu]|uniref:Uncharacterized protein n=1 Tax=Citrus unshiu TaxID=55188 RepID=A0A2H5PTW2_CITUN|nr:hypothetical protein CUMW_166830 [Citrus unshiu]GAY55794.1 hypothetical protein CUMW_166830 [Citrus unshiu]GAY55795.1 hypothetical protein CUMW_166830 [Citrus unshiu]